MSTSTDGAPSKSGADAFNLDNLDVEELEDRRLIAKLWLGACASDSVSSMAETAGVDRRQISRWARGEAIPDRKTAQRLRQAYRDRRASNGRSEKLEQIVHRDLYEIMAREQGLHRIENDVQAELKDPPNWLIKAREAVVMGESKEAVTILEVILETSDYNASNSLLQAYVQHTLAAAYYHLARYRGAEISNRSAQRLATEAGACLRLQAAIEMLFGLISARQDNGYRAAREYFQRAHQIDSAYLTPLFNDLCITARGRHENDFAWAAGALVTAVRSYATLDKLRFFLDDLEQDVDLARAHAQPAYRELLRQLNDIVRAMEAPENPVAPKA